LNAPRLANPCIEQGRMHAIRPITSLPFLLLFIGCTSRPPELARAEHSPPRSAAPPVATQAPGASCFLLYELGVGEVRRAPSTGCKTRATPASTFKIPHALAALDAGVVADEDVVFRYDGSPVRFPSWRRDHTLASAMRDSVVWYFQKIADAMGPAREQEYLRRLHYGNMDGSGQPRRFWLGDSLLVSPEEQEAFLVGLWEDALPVSPAAMRTVRLLLVQPQGVIVNATGAHPFAAPWPEGTVVSAKTGSESTDSGVETRWLVGHVHRAPRSWVFVSFVEGGAGTGPLEAVELGERSLREEHVL
jgi:beta-lactamase class D